MAENLASLQQQVNLKDAEIERLRQELEMAQRDHVQHDQRPPPDVTHQVSVQPDIAADVRQPSAQPDLMPGIGFQVCTKLDFHTFCQNRFIWGNNQSKMRFKNLKTKITMNAKVDPNTIPNEIAKISFRVRSKLSAVSCSRCSFSSSSSSFC